MPTEQKRQVTAEKLSPSAPSDDNRGAVSDPPQKTDASTAPRPSGQNANLCRVCAAAPPSDASKCPSCGASWPLDTFLGQILQGEVRVDEVLGRGGMAVVYLATQTRLGRQVAVKRLQPCRQVSTRDTEWFRQEARLLSQLHHPNLVSVLDFGAAPDGSLYLVMEYVPGKSLRQSIRGNAQPAIRALNIIVQTLAALEEVHRQDIVHRDIKPQNVLIQAVAGEKDFVKLADFGVAHIVNAGGLKEVTGRTPSGPVGTPAYMAPEQIRCERVDHRADIYAAGVLLYELLTGTLPHASNGPTEMLVQRASEPPEPPSVVRPELPIARDLDAICLRALETQPERRYATAAEFRADAKGALELRRAATRQAASEPEQAAVTGDRQWTVLALRPRVDFRNSYGVRTQVERLMLVWDLVERYAADHGGIMTPPDGPTGYVLFEDPRNSTAVPRAASAALALIDKVKVHFPHTELGCGIARGPISGFTGTGTHPPPDAACLSAARGLARSAPPGRIRIEPIHASRLTGAYQKVEIEGGFEVISGPGGRPPSDVESVAPPETSPSLAVRTTLCGRAAAWDTLTEALSEIRAGRNGAAFLLTGPSGVGKSFLCHSLAQIAAPATPVVLAESHPGLDDRPYRPILDLVAQMAVPASEVVSHATLLDGLLVLGVPPDAANTIAGQWQAGTPNDPWVGMAQETDGSLPPDALLRALHLASPLERKLALSAALSAFARTVAGPSGCIFILEDIDRGDEATIAALDGLFQAARVSRVIVVTTARSEGFQKRLSAQWIEVAPLSTDDRISLWASLSPLPQDPSATRDLLRASGGLPLYLRHAAGLSPGPVAQLPAILDMSLDVLPAAVRDALVEAAAVGESFNPAWLGGDVETRVANLDSVPDWVRPVGPGPGWRFISSALYTAARERLDEPARRTIRAAALEGMDPEDLLSRTILAHRIGDCTQTARWATLLGDRFVIAGAPRRGADWYRIALTASPEQELLHLKCGIAALAAGLREAAMKSLAAANFTDPHLTLLAARTRARTALGMGDVDTARAAATEALGLSPAPSPSTAEFMLLLAEVHTRTQEYAQALRAVDTTEAIWRSCGAKKPPSLGWRSALAAGRVHHALGDLPLAEEILHRGVRRASEEMDETGLVQCLTQLAAVALREARGDELRSLCDRMFAGEPPRQTGHKIIWWQIRGQACGADGDLEAARECFERAATLASAAGGSINGELGHGPGGERGQSRWLKSRNLP